MKTAAKSKSTSDVVYIKVTVIESLTGRGEVAIEEYDREQLRRSFIQEDARKWAASKTEELITRLLKK